MIGLVLVTHGNLGIELLKAAEHVCGPQENSLAVAIGADDDEPNSRSAINEAIKKAETGKGVVVITDMFGGTPSNLAISFMDTARIEVLAGASLPMLIKFFSVRKDEGADIKKAAREAMEAGRKYIMLASETLAQK